MPKATTQPAKEAKKISTKKVTKSTAPKSATKVAPKKAKTFEITDAEKQIPTTVKKAAVKPVAAKLGHYFYANGKRKTSVASVRLFTDGKGTITVNDRAFEVYFPIALDQDKVLSPLRITNTLKSFDISVRVHGGGVHSQAEAIRHGISKALLEHSADLRTTLKPVGFLTRDSRIKERKKYGLKRARRAPQWQKR